MKQTRAPFMPVSPDIDDAALESLARDKGVGALVKPVANRVGEGASKTAIAAPTQQVSEAAVAPTTENGATPRSRMKSINIEIPDYAWTDLKIRAAKEQVSVRHIIMSALRGQGVQISDADMVEDGRRLRN